MKKLTFLIISTFISIFTLTAQTGNQAGWVNEFNKQKLYVSILDAYHRNAAVDYGDGFNKGRNDIYASLINLKDKVGEVSNLQILASDKGSRGHIMEISSFTASNGDLYYAITGWRNAEGQLTKEMEWIYPADKKANTDISGIDTGRQSWEDYSNERNPEKLVKSVYTSTGGYYNGGRYSYGWDQVIERYSYMSGQNWSIRLDAVHTAKVTDDLAFEIGTYQSTGKGQYMLIWKKSDNGKWLVDFDFNF